MGHTLHTNPLSVPDLPPVAERSLRPATEDLPGWFRGSTRESGFGKIFPRKRGFLLARFRVRERQPSESSHHIRTEETRDKNILLTRSPECLRRVTGVNELNSIKPERDVCNSPVAALFERRSASDSLEKHGGL